MPTIRSPFSSASSAPTKPAPNGADAQMVEGYVIALPNAAADADLLGERHETSFVNYLRIAFRWGGFLGWERYAERPEKEIACCATDSC